MELQAKIEDRYKVAFRAGQKAEVLLLRGLKSAMKNAEIEWRVTSLNDEQALTVLRRELKRRQEAVVLYRQGNRPELADQEQVEVDIIAQYLPPGMSEAEIETLVRTAIKEVGASGPSDLGKVMALVMPKTKGRADGVLVSKAVKRCLGG